MEDTFTTIGEGRGACGHRHQSIRTALDCVRKDQKGCRKAGGYSDRVVRGMDAVGNACPLTLDEVDTLQTLLCSAR